ncbi:MAG: hypothetical protein JW881_10485 [Spirochaetales bacterium]|nr:hypothetical protein [Spirochaetales bacterium]
MKERTGKIIVSLAALLLAVGFLNGCDDAGVITENDQIQRMIALGEKMQLPLDLDRTEIFNTGDGDVIGIPVKYVEYLPAGAYDNGVYVSIMYFTNSSVEGDYDGLYLCKATRVEGNAEPVVQLVKQNKIAGVLKSNTELINPVAITRYDASDEINTRATCDYVGRLAQYRKYGPAYTKTKCIAVVLLCKNYVWHPEWDCPGYKASSWKPCGVCFGFSW